MSDKTNTLDKPLTIREKIYGTFVKKHIEIIRYEIKGIGIDEADKIFDKEMQKSNKLTNYGSLILFVMLLWELRESFLDSASRSILIFGIYPVYKLIGGVILLILLYKTWKQHLYCYAYKEALQEERYKALIEMDENNNVVLSQELAELVAALKQVQAEVEGLLSKKVTEASIQTFRKFEKLLRKTSETEEFSTLITKEEKQYLRVILKDATKTYNKFQEHAGIRSW